MTVQWIIWLALQTIDQLEKREKGREREKKGERQ